MKRFITLFLCLVLIFAFSACVFYNDVNLDMGNEDKNMEMLNYLRNNISSDSSLDEIIAVFEEMCKSPVEEELLLNEYGVYGFTGEDLFYFDLVRQYPDGEGEYYQLRVSVTFSPDEENSELMDTLWSDETDENFFDYIRKSSGYLYAKNHNYLSVDVSLSQT